MNKKILAVIIAVLVVLAVVICVLVSGGADNNMDSQGTEQIENTTGVETTEQILSTLPGVGVNDFDDSDFQGDEDAFEEIKNTESAEKETDPIQEEIKPTDPTQEEITPTDPTQEEITPTDPTQEETEPSDPVEEGTNSTEPGQENTYPSEEENEPQPNVKNFEWYNSLSGAAQKEFMETFPSVEDFFVWYNSAKKEYEQLHPDIEVGGGSVDLGQIQGNS